MSQTPPPTEHLATLYEITRSLNSTLDLAAVLNYVMDRVIQVTGAERGFLMLLDKETGAFNFKVARGMNQDELENPKFSISRTIVREVQETSQPLLTDNAQSQFSNQQSVVMMALRSIMCVPIQVRDEMIGLVYVDNRMFTGVFNPQHLELVTAFAAQAGFAIENARLYEIAIEQGRMQRELEMAHNIQRGMLPVNFPVITGYEVAVSWESAREVAGDFYDCFLLEDGQVMGVVTADVSDKGAPAALFMAVASRLLRGNAISAREPQEALHKTNALILHDESTTASGMFVTVYYAVFEPGGRMLGVNAGHNLPLLWRARDHSVEWLPKGGIPLGWFEQMPLKTVYYQLEPGDVLVFYTDGLTEAENVHGEPFGEDRLVAMVQQLAPHAHAQEINVGINQAVEDFIGAAPPFDDRTLVVVRYTG
ncbi:MAG: SpoIIE family protein phosphatase [Anaerolineae bacterium]|nr:SpoIIE family protein phosphatase [Anaerolineae bacterium]